MVPCAAALALGILVGRAQVCPISVWWHDFVHFDLSNLDAALVSLSNHISTYHGVP